MRHALIITAYKDVEMLNQIIKVTPRDFGIFVHVDKKSPIALSEIDSRARTFSWKNIYWGSWEHLWVVVELLKEAFKDSRRFDYFHIISAQDFYSVNPIEFDNILGDKCCNYIDIFKLPNEKWGWGNGLDIWRYKTLSSYFDIREQPWRFFNRLYIEIQKKIKRWEKPSFPMYGGSVYCSLHSSFVSFVLEDEFAKNLLRSLKHHLISEEVYFQTVIMNSPFGENVVSNNLRYIDWTFITTPKSLNLEDLDNITDKKTLFARKFESKASHELVLALRERLGLKNGERVTRD